MCVLVTVGYCLPPPSLWPVGVKAGSSLSSKKPIGWLSRSVGSSRWWLGLGSDKGPWLEDTLVIGGLGRSWRRYREGGGW